MNNSQTFDANMLRSSNNVDAAVAAELDWIMHGNTLGDDTIERLANSRIPRCPALLLARAYRLGL